MKKQILTAALIMGTSIIIWGCSSTKSSEDDYYGYNNSASTSQSGTSPSGGSSTDKSHWKNPLATEDESNADNSQAVADNTTNYNVMYVPVIVPWWDYYNSWMIQPAFGFGYYGGFGYCGWEWYSPWYRYHPYYGYDWGAYYNPMYYGWRDQSIRSYNSEPAGRRIYNRDFGSYRNNVNNNGSGNGGGYVRQGSRTRTSDVLAANVTGRTLGNKNATTNGRPSAGNFRSLNSGALSGNGGIKSPSTGALGRLSSGNSVSTYGNRNPYLSSTKPSTLSNNSANRGFTRSGIRSTTNGTQFQRSSVTTQAVRYRSARSVSSPNPGSSGVYNNRSVSNSRSSAPSYSRGSNGGGRSYGSGNSGGGRSGSSGGSRSGGSSGSHRSR